MVFFVAFILLASYLIAYAFNLDQGIMVIAFIFSLGSTAVSYFWGDKIVVGLNGAQPASRKEYFNFYTVTENLSLVAEIPMPKLYVVESDSMNAFATGRDPQHAIVCATTGLLNKLNRTQLEGVIGHELSHVKNFDTRLMMIVSVLVGSLSILINLSWRASFFGNGRRSRNDESGQLGAILSIVGLIMIIFAPIIAQLIQLAISRRREFLADASSVKLTRQPQGLIDALEIISADPNPMKQASTATASLYICNPFKNHKIANMFSTHPPIAARISALEQMV